VISALIKASCHRIALSRASLSRALDNFRILSSVKNFYLYRFCLGVRKEMEGRALWGREGEFINLFRQKI